KDYLDMVRRLEPFPTVQATFNFVPSLVDQLLAAEAGAPDDLFDLLARDPAELSPEERGEVARRAAQLPTHARTGRPALMALAAGLGVAWLASDEAVLQRSLDRDPRSGAHYRPWRMETRTGSVHLFFRDHELSDRIGFVYQRWNAADAVADFLERVRRIGREH